jgi:uncharacterized protein YkwD
MFRRAFRASVIALIVGGCFSYADTSEAAAGGCAGSSAVPNDAAGRAVAARAVLCLVNRQRVSRGLRLLRFSRQLGAAARAHSADMVARGYFGHDSPAGDTLATRVQRSGYAATHPRMDVGEALAWGQQASPDALMRALMLSAVHRRVLLHPPARDVGLGLTLGAPVGGVPGPSATLVVVVGA